MLQCSGDTLDEADAKVDSAIEGATSADCLALSIVKELARMALQNTMGGVHA